MQSIELKFDTPEFEAHMKAQEMPFQTSSNTLVIEDSVSPPIPCDSPNLNNSKRKSEFESHEASVIKSEPQNMVPVLLPLTSRGTEAMKKHIDRSRQAGKPTAPAYVKHIIKENANPKIIVPRPATMALFKAKKSDVKKLTQSSTSCKSKFELDITDSKSKNLISNDIKPAFDSHTNQGESSSSGSFSLNPQSNSEIIANNDHSKNIQEVERKIKLIFKNNKRKSVDPSQSPDNPPKIKSLRCILLTEVGAKIRTERYLEFICFCFK